MTRHLGCPGCDAFVAGLPPVGQSKACRGRLENGMAKAETSRARLERAGMDQQAADGPSAVSEAAPDWRCNLETQDLKQGQPRPSLWILGVILQFEASGTRTTATA